jgi:Protein of unknown function (DUF2852)
MSFAAKLDELLTPVWIALAIVGFVVWWPLGLAILAYLIWSRNMGCCGFDFGPSQERADRVARLWSQASQPHTSGNRAFDEYRAETLRRLEEDQREFQNFLGRLRMAKDKAEFDQFMAERQSRVQTASPTPQSP